MARVFDFVATQNKKLYTLFDSGAENNYITKKALEQINIKPQTIYKEFTAGLGGEKYRIKEWISIPDARLQEHYFHFTAYVVESLGIDRRNSKEIELLLGSHEMQKWNIRIDLKNERLDLSEFTKEFIEF